jgi:hypothetical protein
MTTATTLAPAFRSVPQHVARNPVARAVARRRLDAAMRDFCTRIYLLGDGEHMQADLVPAAHCLAVAVRVCELQGQRDTPALRLMAGGMSAIAQCSERGWRWRELDAPAVDTALHHALLTLRSAGADLQRRAWAEVAT